MLVLTPQSGDVIQVMKAGLIEVVDIIVVNKADLERAERLLAELRATLMPNQRGFEQKIVATQAMNGTGVEELYQAINQRRKRL